MIYLLSGIITGLVHYYLIWHRPRVRPARRHRLMRHYLGTVGRPGTPVSRLRDRRRFVRWYWMQTWRARRVHWLGRAGICASIILLLAAFLHGWHQASDGDGLSTGLLYRFVRSVLIPFGAGILIGMGLMRLFVVAERHFVAALSALGIMTVIAVIYAWDPRLAMFNNLKGASVPGILTLEFGSSGRQPSVQSGSYTSENVGAAMGSGSRRVTYGMNQLAEWHGIIDRDRKYSDVQAQAPPPSHVLPDVERHFAKYVIAPTARQVNSLRKARPHYDLWSLADRHQFARNVRDLAAASQQPFDARQIGLARQVRVRLLGLWSRLCELDPLQNKCTARKANVYLTGSVVIRALERARQAVFHPEHPYGTMLSTLALHFAQEDDAALHDLHNWITKARSRLQTAPQSERRSRLVGLFRAYTLYTYLLRLRVPDPIYLRLAQDAEGQMADTGWKILKSNSWSPILASITLRPKGLVASEVGCPAPKPDLDFQRFLHGQMAALNNHAYWGTLDRERLRDYEFLEQIRASAVHLAALPMSCLDGSPAAPNFRGLRAPVLDTLAAVNLAIAGHETESLSRRKKAACDALTNADKARAQAAKTQAQPSGQNTPDDFAALEQQASAAESLSFAKKRQREARAAIEQLQAHDQCPGLRLAE